MAQELGSRIQAALSLRYKAELAEAETNLLNYMSNAVGVGEHPNVVNEADKLVRQIDKMKSLLATIRDLGYGSV